MREIPLRFILRNMNIGALEQWYQNHQRDLPFRHTKDPYAIWVSEVMLQQTQMESVLPYYARFMNRFPTIESLAKATLEDVLTLVQGIGYYRRFKLLYLGAQYLLQVHQGIFPTTYQEVRSIPGVGEYTSGAIMSIAFNQPYAAMDGNVIRVISRLLGIEENTSVSSTRKKIHSIHQTFIEQATPRIYTQAVMELGALICKPQSPLCEKCPLKTECVALKEGLIHRIPSSDKVITIKQRKFVTFIVWRDNHLAFIPSKNALLEGMYLLPQVERERKQDETLIDTFFHVFSHQKWTMDVVEVDDFDDKDIQWIHRDNIDSIPIPQAHKKIVKTILVAKKSV